MCLRYLGNINDDCFDLGPHPRYSMMYKQIFQKKKKSQIQITSGPKLELAPWSHISRVFRRLVSLERLCRSTGCAACQATYM